MSTIYNISIWFYVIAIRIAALFSPKAKLWIKARKDLLKKLKKSLQNSNKIVWFHCASLGEFEQGKPIIESYKLKHPDHQILLTFFSPSGFEIRKKTPLANWVVPILSSSLKGKFPPPQLKLNLNPSQY